MTVQAADDRGNIANLDVAVTLTDVNEGPEISRIGNLQAVVPENQARDTVLATYTATDPENTAAAVTRWSVSGRDVGDFVISEQGQLRSAPRRTTSGPPTPTGTTFTRWRYGPPTVATRASCRRSRSSP